MEAVNRSDVPLDPLSLCQKNILNMRECTLIPSNMFRGRAQFCKRVFDETILFTKASMLAEFFFALAML